MEHSEFASSSRCQFDSALQHRTKIETPLPDIDWWASKAAQTTKKGPRIFATLLFH